MLLNPWICFSSSPVAHTRNCDFSRFSFLINLEYFLDALAKLSRLAFDTQGNSVVYEDEDVELVDVLVRKGDHGIAQARRQESPFHERRPRAS